MTEKKKPLGRYRVRLIERGVERESGTGGRGRDEKRRWMGRWS